MNSNIWSGTMGGTLLVLFLSVDITQLANTAVLAAVGAAVSFCTSVLLKTISKKIKQ